MLRVNPNQEKDKDGDTVASRSAMKRSVASSQVSGSVRKDNASEKPMGTPSQNSVASSAVKAKGKEDVKMADEEKWIIITLIKLKLIKF